MGPWTQQTANQVRLVKVIQEETGSPGSFPNVVSPCVYKCLPATVSYNKVEGAGVGIVTTQDLDRAIYVANFRKNSPILGAYYLVHQLGPDVYVLDNQMAFLENQ